MINRNILLLVCIVSAALKAEVVHSISHLAGEARSQFRPSELRRLSTAKEHARQAMAALEPMIARSESENFWRTKFRWIELRGELNNPTPKVEVLETIYRGLFSNDAGMEFDEVHRFRDAVRELWSAAYFSSLSNAEEEYRRVLNEIPLLFSRYEQFGRAVDRIDLGSRVAWLERGRLATSLTQAIRARHDQANDIAQFNINVVQRYATHPINQTRAGRNLILGTPTSSHSSIQGQTYLRFIPCETHAEAEVGMTGEMLSQSRGVGGERGVTVQVNSTTRNRVAVSRRISISGLSANGVIQHPPSVSVQQIASQSHIQSSAVPLLPALPRRFQFIRNVKESIGQQTAQSRLPAAQAEGRRIAAGELRTEAMAPVAVPEEVTNISQQYSAAIREFIQLVQQRTGVYPLREWLSTDTSWLYARHIRRNEDELAASAPPPAFQNPNHQLGVRLHESEVTNTANRQLSGYAVSAVDLQTFGRSVLNYVPALLRVGAHAPQWRATLLWDHPFVVDFENHNRVEFFVRFQRVDIDAFGEQPRRFFTVPFGVRVAYRARLVNGTPSFERIEEARLVKLGEESGALENELTQFFLPKARAFFASELFFDGLTPVRGGIFEPLTKILLREFRTENNWLLLGADLDGDLLSILRATPSGLGGNDRSVPR